MNRFLEIDNELIKLKRKYNVINKRTQDNLQGLFEELELNDTRPLNKAKRERLERYIEEYKEKGISNSYIIYLINKILARRYIYEQDLLQIKLLLIYDNQYRQYNELNHESFKEIIRIGYNNALKDINKKKSITNILLLLPLALKKVNAGYIYQDYQNARTIYDTEQIKKQVLINVQQNKELDINSLEFQKIIDIQNKQTLNIKKKEEELKFSGFVELMSTSLYHTGYLQACEDYNIKQVQFNAVMDDNTTKVCKSMDNQVFKLKGLNEYYRFNEATNSITLFKTEGLVQGINLPPITTTYHPCRSTIVAIMNNK